MVRPPSQLFSPPPAARVPSSFQCQQLCRAGLQLLLPPVALHFWQLPQLPQPVPDELMCSLKGKQALETAAPQEERVPMPVVCPLMSGGVRGQRR